MKTQKHNQGELKSLTIKIEKDVAETVEKMAKKAGIPVDELVVVALKRYKSAHAELEDKLPKLD
ncbi:MAG: ribbon-helix-helix protein, CopG family [Bdellovibrionota bacterium]